ncbi:DNA-binding transcriptional LysR family regulator [Sinobacterium caligoides]|uniref:DNA-binding transcriptional LysR family regulator n=1 Tax=Sinobacterium caligoides TaxID=933926 RepID=A0A3N2DG64_9GAMM|nr:LysR family transcriptional regulator [Sinobacterium caligoides]ROR98787.1 DNA-binding transcriptional LysR family regulator [Sinobacterium caligoides]
MTDSLNLNLLTIFLEVYRLRSITLAAESLGLTQPGVSGALKRLKQQLGCELFVREGRGISPTNAAQQLAQQIEPALNNLEFALGNFRNFDPRKGRVFEVFVNEPMMSMLQPLVEQDEGMGNCSIRFNLAPNDEDELLYKLNLQQADLAIDIGQISSQSYHSKPLYSEELVVVCSNDHPRITGSLSSEEYYHEQHITVKVRRSKLYTADYFAEESMLQRKISCESHSLMSMMGLIANSECIGFMTSTFANQYADKLGLQILNSPFETKPVVHTMFWHSRNNNDPAQNWLRDKLSGLLV